MNKKFRFVILGAGNIAHSFCKAVQASDFAEVVAVASRSREKAMKFAEKYQISRYYENYGEMLECEKPEGAYIAVTTNAHAELTRLCIEQNIPVLCEKAMFTNGKEAREILSLAAQKGVFAMEAMWSRFLPANKKAKEWMRNGEIGKVRFISCDIGFCAPKNPDNRYFSPKLGGGVAFDLTVYAYELTTWMMEEQIQDITIQVQWSDTGIDEAESVILKYSNSMAVLNTSFVAALQEGMTLYGEKGKICIPHPHFASEAFLHGEDGKIREKFSDQETEHGFIYEIAEMVNCVRSGEKESPVIPHRDTIACAELFDQIRKM